MSEEIENEAREAAKKQKTVDRDRRQKTEEGRD
jgi:hypothetical protein